MSRDEARDEAIEAGRAMAERDWDARVDPARLAPEDAGYTSLSLSGLDVPEEWEKDAVAAANDRWAELREEQLRCEEDEDAV